MLRDCAQEKNNTDFEVDALHYIGVSYAWQIMYEKAMDYYDKSLGLSDQLQSPKNSIGLYHYRKRLF